METVQVTFDSWDIYFLVLGVLVFLYIIALIMEKIVAKPIIEAIRSYKCSCGYEIKQYFQNNGVKGVIYGSTNRV